MARFAFHEVGYRPGVETVRLTVEGLDGFARGRLFDLYTTQPKLAARVTASAGTWGDAEATAEAKALLEGQGDELVTEAQP